MSAVLQGNHHKKVICLFCGTRTAVPAQAELRSANHVELDCCVSIIRCELCGKEAVYRFEEIVDFQDGAPNRKSMVAGA